MISILHSPFCAVTFSPAINFLLNLLRQYLLISSIFFLPMIISTFYVNCSYFHFLTVILIFTSFSSSLLLLCTDRESCLRVPGILSVVNLHARRSGWVLTIERERQGEREREREGENMNEREKENMKERERKRERERERNKFRKFFQLVQYTVKYSWIRI